MCNLFSSIFLFKFFNIFIKIFLCSADSFPSPFLHVLFPYKPKTFLMKRKFSFHFQGISARELHIFLKFFFIQIPLIAHSSFFANLLGQFSIWLFGSAADINTKSICCRAHCGIVKTSPQTFPHSFSEVVGGGRHHHRCEGILGARSEFFWPEILTRFAMC